MIPTTMRTGFVGDAAPSPEMDTVVALLRVFSKDAMQVAGRYTTACGRRVVRKDDMKRALMDFSFHLSVSLALPSPGNDNESSGTTSLTSQSSSTLLPPVFADLTASTSNTITIILPTSTSITTTTTTHPTPAILNPNST